MKIAVIGFPSSGKRTLFSLLTHKELGEEAFFRQNFYQAPAEVYDKRFEVLKNIYQPKKSTPAKLEIEVFTPLGGDFFKQEVVRALKKADIIVAIIRAFKNENIPHIYGEVSPQRDILSLYSEFVLQDLLILEKKLQKTEEAVEKGFFLNLKKHLEDEKPLKTFSFPGKENIDLGDFLSLKNFFFVINTQEALPEEEKENILNIVKDRGADLIFSSLLSEEKNILFLQELFRKILVQTKTISFFTAGEKELRQWLIPEGLTVYEAAGKIHSDIQKGFIRAEVIKYDDIVSLGGETQVKRANKVNLENKDYLVRDGDLLYIRFNVKK